MKKKVSHVLPNRILELREAIPLTRSQLGELVHTSETQIYRLEMGLRKLTQTWIERIAPVLKVQAYEILLPPESAGHKQYKEPINNIVDDKVNQDDHMFRLERKVEIPVFSATSKGPISTTFVPADIGMQDGVGSLEIETTEMGDAARMGDKAVFAPYPRPIPGDDVIIIIQQKDGVLRLCRRLVQQTDKKITVRQLAPDEKKEYDLSKVTLFKVVMVKKR